MVECGKVREQAQAEEKGDTRRVASSLPALSTPNPLFGEGNKLKLLGPFHWFCGSLE